jgi:hypothetical protein
MVQNDQAKKKFWGSKVDDDEIGFLLVFLYSDEHSEVLVKVS